jgi:thiamine biosynthesis lipoprotein
MASPCEILVRCKNRSEAERLASLSFSETRRIERKFSRYCEDNLVYEINHSDGVAVDVDRELAGLLDYAQKCYDLSGGQFDITSGVLRRAWKFDGSQVSPDLPFIESLRDRVGWDRVQWDGQCLRLQPGMEIDLGGIGKEYAADRVAELLRQESGAALMVNLGGDIRAMDGVGGPAPWIVGIEDPTQRLPAVGQIELVDGGVATSGDARRFCLVDGVRMGHILNPKTGWPVAGAPRSVTVLATYCVEAGLLATLAVLNGAGAEDFLDQQGVRYHCIR